MFALPAGQNACRPIQITKHQTPSRSVSEPDQHKSINPR
jgi:hypothetical protein